MANEDGPLYQMNDRPLWQMNDRPLFQMNDRLILMLLILIIGISIRGRVDDLPFVEYLNPFYFLSIEFHCTFSISYKILPYFVYYYCILVRM